MPLAPRLVAALALLAGLLLEQRLEAQETPSAAELGEGTARVVVRFRPGAAELTTTRLFHSLSARPQELFFTPEAPRGGAFVGLSTRSAEGTLTASLVPDRLAREAYEAATGVAPREGAARDPLLAFLDAWGNVTVQAFPVLPGAEKRIVHRWLAPTEWARGEDTLELPAPSSAPYELFVEAESTSAGFRLAEQAIAGGAAGLTLSGPQRLSRTRAAFSTGVAGQATLLPLSASSGQTWVRARFDLAPTLEATPARAALVIVVDDSRSVSAAERALALRLADGYVASHARAGDPRVAVLRFDRAAHAETPGWVGAERARSVLAAMGARAPSRAHGSRLDAALALASVWLDALPDDLAKRVLVLSDGRLSRQASWSVRSPRGAVLHAVRTVASHETATLAPDTGPLAAWATPSGGLSWTLRADVDSAEPLESAARPLVRADELREATLRAPGLVRAVGRLPEGEGVILDEALPALGSAVALEGALWSRRVRFVAGSSAANLRAEAALASVSAATAGRGPDEITILARLGGAVSRTTAYLGLEPGIRANREGVRRDPEPEGWLLGGGDPSATLDALGLDGLAALPDGAFFEPTRLALTTAGNGTGPGSRRALALEIALRHAARACQAHGTLTARVETTLEEIVDVAAPPCLAEALWQANVPSDDAPEHALTEVTIAAL